jgi:hypothetical protein
MATRKTTKTPTSTLFQQGDVLLQQIPTLPQGAQAKQRSPGRIILAEGEVTGHAHAIEEAEGVQLYTLDQILYLVAEHEVVVTHQEHGPVTLPAGTYQIGIVQEYDYAEREARQVRD